MGAAVADALRVGMDRIWARARALADDLRAGLAALPKIRLRDKGGRWVQTLKTAGAGADGLFVRRELEAVVAGEAIELDKIDDAELQAWLGGLSAPLQAVFVTDFVRDKAVLSLDGGTVVELCVDRGEVRAAGRTEPLSEVELELVQGDVEPLKRLAATLRADVGLTPDNRSKAKRGYALFAAE